MVDKTFSARELKLSSMMEFVLQQAKQLKVANSFLPRLELVAEEVLANIVSYGFQGQEDQEIIISLEYQQQELVFIVQDTGASFDPTKALPPNTEAPLEKRSYGGYGIHLVRQVMDHVQYQRDNNKNILTMKKSGV